LSAERQEQFAEIEAVLRKLLTEGADRLAVK
jgi:hypothetical protein